MDKKNSSSFIRKMKNQFRSCVMAVLAVGMILSSITVPTQAAGGDVTEDFPAEIQNWHRLQGEGIPAFLKVDGEVAWCIEPGKLAHVGQNNEYTIEEIGYTRELGYKLAYIAYYGYKVNPTVDNYVLTQNLLWETIGTKAGNDFYFYVSPQYPTRASQKAWQDAVMAKVNSVYTKPSFGEGSYTIDVGESITLTDTNNILSEYIVSASNGLIVSKNGNQLTITATSSAAESSKIQFTRNIASSAIGNLVAFKLGDSQAVSNVRVSDPAQTSISITVNKYGSLNIAKRDDRGTLVPNTSFKISYNSNMSDPIGTYTTGSDGTVTINELLPQTVYVQEVSVPDHLILDSTIRSITIVPNETVYFSATNDWKQGKIQVVKKDAETGEVVKKAGTQFDILNANNQVVATITTNSEGVALSDFLDYGTYTVREKTAPDGYTVNVSETNPIAVIENNQTYTVDIFNDQVRGSITLKKEFDDTETGMVGDAILEGVTYELHAHEDILAPADGSVLYAKDSLIPNTTKQTDADGKITWTDLYLGSYDVHEVTSNGTVVVNTVDVTADLEYADQNTPNVSVSVTHKDKPNEQPYSLIKIGTDGSNGEVPALEGAEFTAKLKSDVDRLGWDAAPTYDVSTTDSKGYLESGLLPYGTYIVRETKTPDDHYSVPDFTVVITEDSDEPQVWKIFNDKEFEAVIALVKKDAETDKTVQLAGTTFKIRDLSTNEYVGYWEWNPLPHYVDSWTTDESGSVMTGDKLKPGEYQIEEITAPNGYVLNTEPVRFTVSMNVPYQTLPDGETPVITVILEDEPVKGQITVYKEGEMLTGVQQNADGSYSFVYEVMPQSDTEFQIVADADILDPSNDGTVLYEKDEVVETIMTSANGYVTSSDLPLGAYRVEEIKVQDGMVLNKEIKKVTLEYEDQTVEVVYGEASFLNERQKIELNISKADSATDEPLAGAKFGLYAAEDILDYQGDLLLEKDTLIETSVSDKDGKIIFDADFPLYKYYVKEIEAPIGYATTDEIFNIDGSYQGQDVAVIKAEKVFGNDITQVEVSKKDITTKDELPGATLAIYPADADGNPILGECFETWVSTTEPHIVKGLEINTYYVLRETVAPFDQGFVTSQDVLFYVEDTGEVQSVEMWDDVTKVEFSKTDLSTGELIGGATLAVYPVDENGNILKGECFETWLTVAGETHTIYQLPVGNYALVEEVAPFDSGYITAEPVYFEVKDTSDIQQVVMEDDHTKVDFSKTDITTGEPVIGATLAVYPVDEDGNPKLGEAFETWVTDGTDHRIEYLPIGDYILRETVAPFDSGYVTAEDVYFTVDNTGVVQKVEMEDDHTRIEISKVDSDGNFVEGAVLQVIPVLDDATLDEGSAFETYITEDGSHLIEYLPVGKYVLRELTAPEGYVKASDVLFEVKDTSEVQEVEMKDKRVTVSKVDTSGEALEGASMKVIDEDGNVVDEWLSTKEPHAISGLEAGKTYTLVEESAPQGYVIAKSIEFTVTDDGVSQHIEMVDKIVSVEKVDQDGSPLEGAVMQVVSARTKDIVDQWVTDGNVHNIENLIAGEEYILREIEAPTGYHTAEEIVFTVEDNGENQLITVTDEIKIATVHVNKVDAQTNEPILSKDFAFTLYSDAECTEEILTVAGNTKDGYAEFELTYGTWFIKESSAPEGYRLSDEVVKVEYNDAGLFVNGELVEAGEEGYYSIVYLNQLMPVIHIPDTGDNSHIAEISLAALLSGAGMILLILMKHRKEEMN